MQANCIYTHANITSHARRGRDRERARVLREKENIDCCRARERKKEYARLCECYIFFFQIVAVIQAKQPEDHRNKSKRKNVDRTRGHSRARD